MVGYDDPGGGVAAERRVVEPATRELPVPSTFRVRETFDLRSRSILMATGEIVDGVIRVGDRVIGLGFTLRVSGIEMLTRSEGACDIALGFRYSDEGDLARLQQSAAPGTVAACRVG
jgi:hypothetical protein